MAIEATSATSAVESTSTPAPVEGTTTATPAPAQGATTVTPATLPGLAEAVADYQGRRARAMGPTESREVKTEPVEPKTSEAVPSTAVESKPADAVKEPEDKASPDKEPPKAESKPDEVSEGMVRILRQTRALDRQRREAAAEKAAITAEREAHAKSIEAARKFEETRKKDPVTATMELLGKETLGGTFALDLINKLAEQEGGTPPTPDQIAAAATEKAMEKIRAELADAEKAKQAEAEKAQAKAKQERDADVQQKKTVFFTGLAHQLMTDAEKYPYLVAKPVDWEGPGSVDEFVLSTFNKTGRAPSPDEIFKHFDGEREKDAQALAAIYLKRNPPSTAPAKRITTSIGKAATDAPRDTRGRIEQATAGETQRERLERVARELNQSFGR